MIFAWKKLLRIKPETRVGIHIGSLAFLFGTVENSYSILPRVPAKGSGLQKVLYNEKSSVSFDTEPSLQEMGLEPTRS